jgi:hypothetical protein
MTGRLGGSDTVASTSCRLIGSAQAGHCSSRSAGNGIGAGQGSGVRGWLVPACRGARSEHGTTGRFLRGSAPDTTFPRVQAHAGAAIHPTWLTVRCDGVCV